MLIFIWNSLINYFWHSRNEAAHNLFIKQFVMADVISYVKCSTIISVNDWIGRLPPHFAQCYRSFYSFSKQLVEFVTFIHDIGIRKCLGVIWCITKQFRNMWHMSKDVTFSAQKPFLRWNRIMRFLNLFELTERTTWTGPGSTVIDSADNCKTQTRRTW